MAKTTTVTEKIDTDDNDCQPGGPCPLCLRTLPPQNDGDITDVSDENDGDITDVSDENDGDITDVSDENDGDITDVSDENDGDSFLPQAIAELIQTAEGQITGEIYYILIERAE